jgi:hypothetical protein
MTAVKPETSGVLRPQAVLMRRPFNPVRMAPDMARRQGNVTRLAFERLGREAAMAFLNESNDALGGRPLDIATGSVAGFEKIKVAIEAYDVAIKSPISAHK